MAVITDINKLRPELMDKSEAEMERQITEWQMALAEKRRLANIAAKQQLADQAAKAVDDIVEGVKFLHGIGALPEKLQAALSRADGMFAPGMMLRAPSAETLAMGDQPGKPRRASVPRSKRG